MKHGFFIAGTDTGVGKTEVTLALMDGFKSKGYTVAGMKPVASGCEQADEGLRNDDAMQIHDHASESFPYAQINPYAFVEPIAPHIASENAGMQIDLVKIKQSFRGIAAKSDIVIVEGVGGWQVPLGSGNTMADLAVLLGLPIILVVGLRLGCINHAILSMQSIEKSGLPIAGWMANQMQPEMDAIQENINSLKEYLHAPFLGCIPYIENARIDHDLIEIDALI